jgi:hypothetical protein
MNTDSPSIVKIEHFYRTQGGMCRGDDHLGMPKAAGPAGWRPRDQRYNRPGRPAPTEGPAAPAAGSGFLRWRPKPATMTPLLTDALLKSAGTRQKRQRAETAVTPATDRRHQPPQ